MTTKKSIIYLDTNIVSTLHYDGTDINGLARRMATRDWWDSERRGFELFGSIVTEQELADGVYGSQPECVRFVRRLKYVPISEAVRKGTACFQTASESCATLGARDRRSRASGKTWRPAPG